MKKTPGNARHELIEALAEIEHEQWMHWSRAVAAKVPPALRTQWQNSWVPYVELSDKLKAADRIWARKVVRLLRRRQLI